MWWFAGIFVVCAVVAGLIAPAESNQGFKDAPSALAFISLVAVAIERVIEGFFTVIASKVGEWWPLSVVRTEFDAFEKQANEVLGPIVATTLKELAAAKALAGQTDAQIQGIQDLIDEVTTEQARLQTQLDEVTSKLAPGSERLARAGEISSAMAATLHSVHERSNQFTTAAQAALKTAGDAADNASLIISSFQDNPARRVASLVLGMSLGMLIAAGVGLNVFVATLADSSGTLTGVVATLAGVLGVILTGLIVGLGSAPTHEIVKSLQAYKEGRNAPAAVTTMTTGAGSLASSIQEGVVLEAFDGSPPSPLTGAIPASFRVRQVRRTG